MTEPTDIAALRDIAELLHYEEDKAIVIGAADEIERLRATLPPQVEKALHGKLGTHAILDIYDAFTEELMNNLEKK